jgi:hypothetical protein
LTRAEIRSMISASLVVDDRVSEVQRLSPHVA